MLEKTRFKIQQHYVSELECHTSLRRYPNYGALAKFGKLASHFFIQSDLQYSATIELLLDHGADKWQHPTNEQVHMLHSEAQGTAQCGWIVADDMREDLVLQLFGPLRTGNGFVDLLRVRSISMEVADCRTKAKSKWSRTSPKMSA
jgi:hypothetical protein